MLGAATTFSSDMGAGHGAAHKCIALLGGTAIVCEAKTFRPPGRADSRVYSRVRTAWAWCRGVLGAAMQIALH